MGAGADVSGLGAALGAGFGAAACFGSGLGAGLVTGLGAGFWVLAGAVNFGLGFLVDMVKNIFIDGVMKMANTLLGDTLKDIKRSVQAKLQRSRNVGKRGSGLLKLVQTIGKLAGEVKTQMRRASQGIQGTISGVVATALDKFLLRGIANPDLRKIISKAVSFVIGKVTGAASGRGETVRAPRAVHRVR